MPFRLSEKYFGAKKDTLELLNAHSRKMYRRKQKINKLKPCQIRGSFERLASICCVVFVKASMLPMLLSMRFCLLLFTNSSVESFEYVQHFKLLLILSVVDIVLSFFAALFVAFLPFILANRHFEEIERHLTWFKANMRMNEKNHPEKSFILKFIYLNYIYYVQMQFSILNHSLHWHVWALHFFILFSYVSIFFFQMCTNKPIFIVLFLPIEKEKSFTQLAKEEKLKWKHCL